MWWHGWQWLILFIRSNQLANESAGHGGSSWLMVNNVECFKDQEKVFLASPAGIRLRVSPGWARSHCLVGHSWWISNDPWRILGTSSWDKNSWYWQTARLLAVTDWAADNPSLCHEEGWTRIFWAKIMSHRLQLSSYRTPHSGRTLYQNNVASLKDLR